MDFEFHPQKSEINKAKHGIDFIEAQALWKSKIVLLGAKDASEKDIWRLEQSIVSTGRQLSPIAERGFGLLVSGNPPDQKSRCMRKARTEPTTAKNLEEKFDRGEDVLDYFDVRRPRVIRPRAISGAAKGKFAYPAKRNSRSAAVREKSAAYRKSARRKAKR